MMGAGRRVTSSGDVRMPDWRFLVLKQGIVMNKNVLHYSGFMLLVIMAGAGNKVNASGYSVQQPADSVFSDFKPFADVDTSDNAIFKEAQLDDLR